MLKSIEFKWLKSPFSYGKMDFGYADKVGIIHLNQIPHHVEKGFKCKRGSRHTVYFFDVLKIGWTTYAAIN